MNFLKYPEYTDSGVQWLGKVPSHWNVMPFKWQIFQNDGGAWGGDPSGDSDDTIVLRSTEQTVDGRWKIENPAVRKLNMSERLATRLRKDDLVVTKSSGSSLHIGKTTLVTSEIDEMECSFGNFMQRIRVDESFHAKLAWYILNNDIARRQLDILSSSTTGLANLNGTLIGEIILAVPTLEEQHKIANFLDHETSRIDALIEEQQRLIELLKEKRQAVISYAVTKGLDPGVPMKDSGVEWLGEVPEHWTVGSLKHILEIVADVDHYMPASVDSGVPYVMTGDLRTLASEIDLNSCKQIARDDFLKLTKKIRTSKGDVIMARYATIGTVCYVDISEDFIVSYSCVTIRPRSTLATGIYLFFYFQSDAFIQGISNMINANTQNNVGIADLKEVKVVLPDIHEQEALVHKIQTTLAKQDRIIKDSTDAIRLLAERRSALISAAVTGKIDVRNWQAPAESETEIYPIAAEPEPAYQVSRS